MVRLVLPGPTTARRDRRGKSVRALPNLQALGGHPRMRRLRTRPPPRHFPPAPAQPTRPEKVPKPSQRGRFPAKESRRSLCSPHRGCRRPRPGKEAPSLEPPRPTPRLSGAWSGTLGLSYRLGSGAPACRALPQAGSKAARRRTGSKQRPPVIYLSNPAQILFSYMSRCLAVLAVSSLIYKQGSALVRSRLGVFVHQLYPAPIDLFRVPAGLREKPLQRLRLLALRSNYRFRVSQSGKGLVALFIQQQTFEVTAEPLALGALRKEIVEVSGVILERTGGGLYGHSLSHGNTSYWDHH